MFSVKTKWYPESNFNVFYSTEKFIMFIRLTILSQCMLSFKQSCQLNVLVKYSECFILYFVTLVSVLMIIPSVQRIKYEEKTKKKYLNYNNCMKVAIFAHCFSLNWAATSSLLAKVSIFSWFCFQLIPYNVDTFLSTLITGLSYSSIPVSLHCIMFTIEMNECWK